MEIFCNYALFFVQNIDHIGFCYRASLCLGMMARLNETIDNLHNSSYCDINGVYETMGGATSLLTLRSHEILFAAELRG